jgi:hypothetical protein
LLLRLLFPGRGLFKRFVRAYRHAATKAGPPHIMKEHNIIYVDGEMVDICGFTRLWGSPMPPVGEFKSLMVLQATGSSDDRFLITEAEGEWVHANYLGRFVTKELAAAWMASNGWRKPANDFLAKNWSGLGGLGGSAQPR